MEPVPLLLLLLLLAAPLGRSWAESEETLSGENVWNDDQPGKEDVCPWTDPDLKTNCMNKCKDNSICRGNMKCCHIMCQLDCPAKQDTNPKKEMLHTIGCCSSTHSSDTNCPKHLEPCPPRRRNSRLVSVDLRLLSRGRCKEVFSYGLCRKNLCCYSYSYGYGNTKSCHTFFHGCIKNVYFNTMHECLQACPHGLHKR